MKKVVAFLLALIIFVAPVTTLVKADVVIGDNDETIMNENATILGRKLAMLESLSDLALSGVTEYTISNTEDVDSYLDSLWSEINDAIDYLDSGDWVGDIPNNIASKYYTNLVNYRDVVNNRGEFLGFDLQNPTTSLLKTYFANDTYGKKYTSTNLYQSLDMVRALSDLNRNQSNVIPSNIQMLIDIINKQEDASNRFWLPFKKMNTYQYNNFNIGNYTWFSYDGAFPLVGYGTSQSIFCFKYQVQDVHINSIGNNEYNCQFTWGSDPWNFQSQYGGNITWYCFAYYDGYLQGSSRTQSYWTINFNHTGTLEQVFNALKDKVKNVNIYVDDVLWASVGDSSSYPTLDIDGFMKIYGNNQPQQYELQPNTQIDYDELYQVIYNAIRDNLPINQGDINYYDSHDTIYSPTIINNYGEEEGDENDLIDTILDYAVIPKFDTAIAQPMRSALTNGVVIMNTSINNVIPDEILLILGACFFLLLFAVVINRMIK